MARRTTTGVALAALAGVLALAGCVPVVPTPVPTQAASTASASPTPTAPAEPTLVEGGTAQENQPYFDKVSLAYYESSGMGSSRGAIDNLVAAGFRLQDMEVTMEKTAIDLDVDSRIFSVRLKGECLIGEFQQSGYRSIVATLLSTGGCLIGATLPLG